MEEIKDVLNEFQIVDNLSTCLNTCINDIQDKICKRKRCIFMKDMLYFLCCKNINDDGSSVTISKLKNKLQDKNSTRRPFDFDESSMRRFISKMEVADMEG